MRVDPRANGPQRLRLAAVAALAAVWSLAGCAPTGDPGGTRSEPEPRRTWASLHHEAPTPPDAIDEDPRDGVFALTLVAAQGPAGGPRYTYNGTSPGPTIRARLGDAVVVTVRNELDDPTTVHWHGLHVPVEMDGVPGTVAPIPPGGTFEYRFVVTQAGTFWYHPHFDTEGQVDGGLYGAFVVEDPRDPVPDHDVVLVFDADEEHTDSTAHPAHGHGRIDGRWRVNGRVLPTLAFAGGARIRVRALNASNAGYVALRWPDMRHIGSDQGLLPRLEQPERVVLGPGDRADFEWLIGETGFVATTDSFSLNGGDAAWESEDLFSVAVEAPAPRPSGLDWPFDGATPSGDPGYADVVWVLQGSDRTNLWFINGERFPDVTVPEIPLGQPRVIEVRNLSPTRHPFHIHGMNFEVLSVDGAPPPYRMVEDTIDLGIRETVRLLVRPPNPGEWMAHCHILPHAEDGMMTMLHVSAH